MSQDALSPQQFEHVDPITDIGHMGSRDYPGKLRDLEFAPGGESDSRVNTIMESARTEGIKEPLDLRESGKRYLHDGHHRYVAAKRLGINVPVRGF